MKTKRLSVLTLMAVCVGCVGFLGAGPAQAYPLWPTPTILPAPVVMPDPEVTAAVQTLHVARSQSDLVKSQVLLGEHNTPEYQQALTTLNTDQDQMHNLKASLPYPQEQISDLATTILADENQLTRLEQPTLNASPEYQMANAGVQDATQSLGYVQQLKAQEQPCANIEAYHEQLAVEHAQRRDWQTNYRHEGRLVTHNCNAYRGR